MLMMFALLAAQAQPPATIPPSAETLRAHPPIVSVPIAPPMVRVMPSLEGLSASALAKARALNADIAEDKRSGEQHQTIRASEANFRDALNASPPVAATLREAASAYDEARGMRGHYNERWVTLAQSLAPADRDLLLKALPTPRGDLQLPAVETPRPGEPQRTPEQQARNAAGMAAFEKLTAALKSHEASQPADTERVVAARQALQAALVAKPYDAAAVTRAFDTMVDLQATLGRNRGHVLAATFARLTPEERDAMSASIGSAMAYAAMGR